MRLETANLSPSGHELGVLWHTVPCYRYILNSTPAIYKAYNIIYNIVYNV